MSAEAVDEATRPGDPETAAAWLGAIADNMERVVSGKRSVIELLLVSLLAEGHVLIDDVPGVGKTLLAKALAASIAATSRRVQFTPDLLPSDVTGSNVLDGVSGALVFRPGPAFANVLLCDEINRAPAKTQSALLEAMEERQITNDTSTYVLPWPFMVIATQNPYEHAGTYQLPESQLDRFLLRTIVGYPDREAERTVLERDGSEHQLPGLRPVADIETVRALIGLSRQVHVAPVIRSFVLDLVEATRNHSELRLGASPRAALALQRASRARALTQGRGFVTPDDVTRLAGVVLGHRVQVVAAHAGDPEAGTAIVQDILRSVAAPGKAVRGRR